MNEFELRRQLHELQAERQPAQDLWPAIAARLASPVLAAVDAPAPVRASRPVRALPWALAAGLMLCLAGAASLEQRHQIRVAEANQVEAGERMRERLSQLDASYSVADAELAAMPSERGDVHAVPALENANATLLAAEQELRDTLLREPRAEFLLDLLARAKSKQLAVERMRREA